MSDAIERAANAFDVAMGNAAPAKANGEARDLPPEPIFGNSNDIENDLQAGGDDEPDPKPKKARKAEREEEVIEREADDDLDEEVDPDADDDDEDGDADEQDADDDDEEDVDEELLNRQFRVMVDGEEVEVPLREALDGYIRTQTFHRRLNKLSEVEAGLRQHAAKIVEDRSTYDTMLAEAEEVLQAVIPAEPDWDKLFQEDPKGARELQKQDDGLKSRVAEIREKRAKASRDQAEKDRREQIEFAQKEFPKFAAYAKWRDRKEMDKDLSSMKRTASAAGFSDQEQAEVLDSRMLMILHKASKYDRMMAARPKAVKNGKIPVNPGAGSNRTARRGVIGAQKKLARSGSIDDATDVFAKILNT
jgi:hypothetical protein